MSRTRGLVVTSIILGACQARPQPQAKTEVAPHAAVPTVAISSAGSTSAPQVQPATTAHASASPEAPEPIGEQEGSLLDPLRQRVVTMYRRRLVAFFRRGFVCPATAAGARDCLSSATFAIQSDGTVTSFTHEACGTPNIDSLVQTTAKSKVGQRIPPPPNDYPELQSASLSVAYTCR
jgi:hypothetical protein